nr:MAG TPA: hypothetical protein [Caudoviricetes sp.]DAL83025.1 MAG TPA: hypothetical protein [Caudoviricetes sp.]DAM20414.1 MAG TPA: hypothetical protein [Caudoviricetes sp.]DAZ50864.1 MAG TPA: hypothetical protein [Caudoviricetes sp.]
MFLRIFKGLSSADFLNLSNPLPLHAESCFEH